MLLDLTSYDQVYLVDFGLASRCTKNTKLKADPKKAHNGTLQYTSRDAHIGGKLKKIVLILALDAMLFLLNLIKSKITRIFYKYMYFLIYLFKNL